jgi:transposase
VDFRKGIDGLSALCRQALREDPFSGTLFVFTNRLRTAVKILVYDGQGFWLCSKRFSRGRLAWWPQHNQVSFSLNASQLQILLFQGDPMTVTLPLNWRPLPSPSQAAIACLPRS